MSLQTLAAAGFPHLTNPDHHSLIAVYKVLIVKRHRPQPLGKNFKKKVDPILMIEADALFPLFQPCSE